ncbi:MAG: GNAT family N-acetyltransferase [Oscillospiraceae bacterium]|jgi:RimJ/RimL family protein N-acetyltransferase|nr:GNAT family N-acetyltransferase [Oscillospiraceae bacterium]
MKDELILSGSGGVSLRPWRLSDAPALGELLSNKKLQDNLRDGLPYPYTAEDGESYISSMLKGDKNKLFAFAIVLGDKLAGSIGAFRQSNIHSRTAELGYYVGESFWGRGVGTTAVKLLCRHVFETTDILRIYAEPFATNAASCRVLEKSGFRFEGTLRQNAVKNGNILDMHMYSLLKKL